MASQGLVNVSILTPESRFWEGEARIVSVNTVEGSLGIMKSHQPMFCALSPSGVVVIEQSDGSKRFAAVSGGFLSVSTNKLRGSNISILADMVDWVDIKDKEAIDAEYALTEKSQDLNPANYLFAKAKVQAIVRISQ